MICLMAVTFEFEWRAPESYRTTIEATSAATCAARAIREANKALAPRNWTSMNCVVLERTCAAGETDYDASENATESMPSAPPQDTP